MYSNTESCSDSRPNGRYGWMSGDPRLTDMSQEASRVFNRAHHSNVPTSARAGYTITYPYYSPIAVPQWNGPLSPPLSWSFVQPTAKSTSFADPPVPTSSSLTTDPVFMVPTSSIALPVSTSAGSVTVTSVSTSPMVFSSVGRRRRNFVANLPTSSVSGSVTTSAGSVTTSVSSSTAIPPSVVSALPRNFTHLNFSAPISTSAGSSSTSVSSASVNFPAAPTSTRNSSASILAPSGSIPASVRSPSHGVPLPSWIQSVCQPPVNLPRPLSKHIGLPANFFPEPKQPTDICQAVREIVDGAMEKFTRGMECKMQEMEDRLLTEILSTDAVSKNCTNCCEKKDTKKVAVTNKMFEEAMHSLKTRLKGAETISEENTDSEIPKPSTSTGNSTRPTDPTNIANDPDPQSDDQSNSNVDICALQIDLAMRSKRIRELEEAVVRMSFACRESASNLRRDILNEFEGRLSELERKVDSWNDEYSYYDDDADSQDYYF